MTLSRGWLRSRRDGFSLEVDWHVEQGEVLVLFGPSGAGKTTTLRAIAGLARPERGRVEIGGRVVYDSEEGVWVPAHQRRVGYLTQRYHLFPHLTVARNIAYGAPKKSGVPRGERVRRLIELFRLGGLEQRRVWQLSGGEQQRVAFARALASEPELLLLDEPFASLDAELRRILREELRSMLAASPVPVLLVTHDKEEALALGHSALVFDRGRVIERGEPFQVLGQPGRGQVARMVGVENLLRLEIDSRNPRDGTMICVGMGLRLEAPLGDAMPNEGSSPDRRDPVTIGIRSSDIILSKQEPVGSSARNRLQGVVTNLQPSPPGFEVTVECGVPLRAQITGAALSEMGIEAGQDLWAVFKASSCFLVQEDAPADAHDTT